MTVREKALKDGREKAAQPREMSTTTQLGLRADLTCRKLAQEAKDHPTELACGALLTVLAFSVHPGASGIWRAGSCVW